MKTVLVTNKTPIQVAILGSFIPARAIQFSVDVLNVPHFEASLKNAYPCGSVFIDDGESHTTSQAIPSSTALSALELSTNVEKSLAKHGIESVEALAQLSDDDVLAIKGIAAGGLQEIQEALTLGGFKHKETGDDN